MIRLSHIVAFLTATLGLGCANGDGRGFGTVSGKLRVTFAGTEFETSAGETAKLQRVTVTVSALTMDAPVESASGAGTRTATFAVGSSFGPLAGDFALPFGPFEVDRGDYATLGVKLTLVEFEGEVGDESFKLMVQPKGGIVLTSPAALPVNDTRAPNIDLSVTVKLATDLLDGVDPTTEAAVTVLEGRVATLGQLGATWTRTDD